MRFSLVVLFYSVALAVADQSAPQTSVQVIEKACKDVVDSLKRYGQAIAALDINKPDEMVYREQEIDRTGNAVTSVIRKGAQDIRKGLPVDLFSSTAVLVPI